MTLDDIEALIEQGEVESHEWSPTLGCGFNLEDILPKDAPAIAAVMGIARELIAVVREARVFYEEDGSAALSDALDALDLKLAGDK